MSAFLRHRLDVAESRAAELGAELHTLRAENERLREALRPFAARANYSGSTQIVTLGACKRAAAALSEPQP